VETQCLLESNQTINMEAGFLERQFANEEIAFQFGMNDI